MPASRFLRYTGSNWPNPVCSFYLPLSTSRDDPVLCIERLWQRQRAWNRLLCIFLHRHGASVHGSEKIVRIPVPLLDLSDSSERLELINKSEEMGHVRDTSTHVTFNTLNSTSWPRILNSLFILFERREGEKKESSNVRLGSKLRN